MGNMDVEGMYQGANMLTRPAEEYVNDVNVEAMWAARAGEYADVHYNLLCSADPKLLKLTNCDDRIYSAFLKHFSNFKLDEIDVASLKSNSAKEKWRVFCEAMKDIEDFSFGTLLRLKSSEEYSEENTILVTRVQFHAIEIGRNRQGYNDYVWRKNSIVSSS